MTRILSTFLLLSRIATGASAAPAPVLDEVTRTWRFEHETQAGGGVSGGVSAGGAAPSWTFTPNVRPHPETTGQHLWPDIAVSATGTVGVAWMDDHAAGGYHIFYSQSTDGGVTWSAPEKIDTRTVGSYSKFVDLDFTPSGMPIAVWEDDRLGNMNVFLSKRDPAAGGTPWTANVRVNTTGGAPSVIDFMNPSLAVLDDARYFVAWTDWREGVYYQVYARGTRNGGTTWTAEARISDEIGFDPVAGDPCLIAETSPSPAPGAEKLYCVMNDWRGDVPGGRYPNVYFSRSTNGGASWSTGVRVNDIEPLYQQVSSHALVKLPDGTLTAGWLNSNVSVSQFRTCVSTNEGATWSASVRADEPSPGGAGTYSSIAAFGTWVFAGYDAYDGNWNAWMRASSDGGRSWTEPAARMDDDVTGSPSGNTVIAPFSPTTIYGAWQDGRPTPAPWLIMTTRGTRQGTDVGETWATQGTGDTGRTGLVLRPNPARSGEEIHIGFARESGHAPVITPGAVVGIYDLLGRVVRILPVSAQGAVWDGRDSGGRVVAPGLYRARYDAASSGAPILVIR